MVQKKSMAFVKVGSLKLLPPGSATHFEIGDGDAIERESEYRTLLFQHADDGVRHALHPELASQRVEIGEEVLGDLVTDYDDGRTQRGFLRGERASKANVVFLDCEVVAVDRVRFHLLGTHPL